MKLKFTENFIPPGYRAQVTYLYEGRRDRKGEPLSKSKLKRIGKHPTKYVTIASLFDPSNVLLGQGKAVCSTNDSPCRRIGRQIAIGRAMAQSGVFYERH